MNKRTISVILAILMLIALAGCGEKPKEPTEKDLLKAFEGLDSQTTLTEKPKPTVKITLQEFEELLAKQPVTVFDVDFEDAMVRDSNTIICKVKNNTYVAVKDITLGYVAWDEDNLPVCKAHDNPGRYLGEATYNAINISSGAVFEANMANMEQYVKRAASFYPADLETTFRDNPIRAKVIVLSFTDIDGNIWNNPHANAFKTAFVNLEYKDDIIIEVEK